MSEGEVEVAPSSYEVLPKEVLAEVGSVKLFSTSDLHILAIRALDQFIVTRVTLGTRH